MIRPRDDGQNLVPLMFYRCLAEPVVLNMIAKEKELS